LVIEYYGSAYVFLTHASYNIQYGTYAYIMRPLLTVLFFGSRNFKQEISLGWCSTEE
jgi:hypothetical protein